MCSRCNVLPVHIYKKATGDYTLKDITAVKSSIVAYDGGSIPVLGKTQAQRGSFPSLLLYRRVESKRCRPILNKTVCEEMGVVRDADAIRRPDTSGRVMFSA